ncbi:MAG: phosphohydrolase, partial [Desulfotomaculaceae bacterium]|nr:phosphohydrolase [Desulfotomaculaceae bacterium]
MFFKNILETIAGLASAKNKKIYLVGGFLRDLYLGNPGPDLDFAVSGNAMELAKSVSEILQGVYIPLDRINRVARIVLESGGEKWQIDFSSFKGVSIEEDLSNRDFTINATALELF